MSVSAISSTSSQSSYVQYSKLKEELQDLATALKSGNLSDAQKAYGTLQSETATQASGTGNPMQRDIQSLGSALESGNLEDAQKTLAEIQKHLQGRGEFARQQLEMQSSWDSESTQQQDSTEATTSGGLSQDFQSLVQALSSGNLEEARKAFATLQQNASANQQGSSDDPLSKDLAGVGSSLESGDLQQAQDKLTKIEEKLSHRPEGPPPPRQGEASSAQDQLQQDLASLGSALESGNLEDAQQALATLQTNLGNSVKEQSAAASHPHRQHAATAASETTDSVAAASTANSTNGLGDTLQAAILTYLKSSSRSADSSGSSASGYL
jgi:hypothetical protein